MGKTPLAQFLHIFGCRSADPFSRVAENGNRAEAVRTGQDGDTVFLFGVQPRVELRHGLVIGNLISPTGLNLFSRNG